MAQEPTADDIDAWNIPSQPDDSSTTATVTFTGGDLLDLLTTADDTKETLATTMKSPVSEENFPAWELHQDAVAFSPQDAPTTTNALRDNVPTSLDAAIHDSQKPETTTRPASVEMPLYVEKPETPDGELINGTESAHTQPAQPLARPVEASVTYTETAHEPSGPAISAEVSPQPQIHKQQENAPLRGEEPDDSKELIAQQFVLPEVEAPPVAENIPAPPMPAEDTSSSKPQNLPIESELNLVKSDIEETAQSETHEQLGIESAPAHKEQASEVESESLPIDPEQKENFEGSAIDDAVQPIVTNGPLESETTSKQLEVRVEPTVAFESAGQNITTENAIGEHLQPTAAQDPWAIDSTPTHSEVTELKAPSVDMTLQNDLNDPVIEEAEQEAAGHDPRAVEPTPPQPDTAEKQNPQRESADLVNLQESVFQEPAGIEAREQSIPLEPFVEPTQAAPEEHVAHIPPQETRLGTPVFQILPDKVGPLKAARADLSVRVDDQESRVKHVVQKDFTEQTEFNTPPVEGKTDGNDLWDNEPAADVDSDGDEFFNQLKTQTKPIFASPESESRFEEGVPLLDDTYPTSPPLAIPQRKTVENPFGDGDDGADFFTSIQNSHASKELPIRHITRKSTSQVVESMGFDVDSPSSDISAAAQLEEVLKSAASSSKTPQAIEEPQASQSFQAQQEAPEPTEEELAARWEAELSDVGEEDLAAQWEAALDDDDILLGDESTPAQPIVQNPMQSAPNAPLGGLNSPFETPQSYGPARAAPSVYTPHQPSTADLMAGVYMPGVAQSANPAIPPYFSQQPQNPVASRGESFAEASKQGYKSPYDLPDDLSRPRRPLATSKPAPQPVALMPPPASSTVAPPANTVQAAAATAPAAQSAPKNFYEELPLPAPKSRPAGSGRYTPNPSAAGPTSSHMPPPQNPYAAVSGPAPAPGPGLASVAAPPLPSNGIPVQSPLQPPERLEPYGSMLATSVPAGPPAASRYSPQPPDAQAPAKPSQSPRYSPAPPPAGLSPRNRYASQPLSVPGQNLPFQPRTSSPLAYHEKVSYQPEDSRQHQLPSLQPSVDLSPPRFQRASIDQGSSFAPQDATGPHDAMGQPVGPPAAQRQTPPPAGNRYAPQDYINEFAKRVTPSMAYAPPAPQMPAPGPPQAADPQMPPLRSQTQSPGQHMISPRASVPPISTIPRPASVHGSSSPTKTPNPYAPSQPSVQSRARALSQRGLGFVTPTDGQEHDVLERWKGAPIFKFGFGGAVLSCFPKHIPRYSAGQTAPMLMPSPGEIKTAPLNQWLPAAETIVQHPGPLRAKSKKKDLVSWLSGKIVALENEPTPDFDLSHPESQRRHEERILLWKVMKILVENDGTLEGSPAIENSLRQAIFPHLSEATSDGFHASGFPTSGVPFNVPLVLMPLTLNREEAVWAAVDRRLWGHAMIVASTMDKSIWKQVVQEFVRREVRSSGGNTESLAALYEIFAGNIEESIDELVPPSARAGHRLISKADGQGTTKNALDGLNCWKDTLGLVLSNRSSEDQHALLALGRLLASYGRTEAAHICFIFSRAAVFGGADDPQANIVLLGVDHQQFHSGLLSEDAFLLTEVYEYATSILGNSPVANLPYLLAFKLLHARQLADRGRISEAQNYCDAVGASLKATTRPSPYHHQLLFTEADELSARLRQTTTDGGSSWISKPSMEKVSGSMWARFNSFVAGDDADPASAGAPKSGETAEFGPFANVAGTPTVSRSPSVSELYGSYPGHGAQSVPPGGASRYLPSTQYAPNASPEQFRGRSSLDSQRSASYGGMPVGLRRSSTDYPSPPVDFQSFQGGPIYGSPGSTGYQPTPPQASYIPLAPVEEDASLHGQSPADALTSMQPPVNGLFYQPSGQDVSQTDQSPYYQGPPDMPQSDSPAKAQFESSYTPPATTGNAYDPPSYTPDFPPTEEPEQYTKEEAPPKKKSFMDDDDDDLAARSAALKKAENDRKADEAFRKAAEEDAKKDAQQQKKGWFGGWFGGAKKEAEHTGGGPIRAKLGEENSFYYDKELKKWVNKKDPGSAKAVRATPPPPRGSAPPSRTSSGSMPPPPPPGPPMSASGSRPQSSSSDMPPSLSSSPAFSNLGVPPPILGNLPRSVSTGATVPVPPGASSAPGPPRPTSSLSHAQSIDDLLGAPMARKGNNVRGKKKGRYIDVMAK
ncbi:uncharacterized protein N7477_004606 [Penicillium maclennaniae]|uniref:uncharacterized protein n=1 Tax=Penicillium maclennaniae TaxID=1343394 RepID=UPI00253FF4BE|nr:uncharacterized protein N7477_004606 [Penicillium maclennaniae]KAJ5674672.1 hypothetical protein N7477_004606 [Penicillium maclennaniae]